MPFPDDDIAAVLPAAPPPAPTRREAVIAAALRRFDGVVETPPQREGTAPAWWATRRCPQIAAFVAVSLVALVGAPVVWMSAEHRSGRAAEEQLAMADSHMPPPSMADMAPAPPPPAKPSTATHQAVADTAAPRDAGSDSSPPSAALPPAAARDGAAAKIGPTAPKEPEQRYAAAPPPPLIAPPAPGAAPTAPPASAMIAARSAQVDTIVVTSRRIEAKPAEHEDWSACTVDDPRQSLVACTDAIRSASPGSSEADVHMADGLSAAWRGDFADAIRAFDQAPKRPSAYLNRALAYAHIGDLDHALRDADRAVRLAPNAAQGYHVRAQVFRQRGEPEKAARDEDRARGLDPGDIAIGP